MYIKENFYWWMSEDDLLGGNDKYLYSEWIDTTSKGGYMQLMPKPSNVVSTDANTVAWLLPITNPTTDATLMLAFTTGGVYREWTVGQVSTNVWTTTNFIIEDKIYLVKDNWATSAYTLYEEDVSTASSSSWTETLVTTTDPLPTANYDWYMKWTCVVWDVAYIFLGSKIARFSPKDGNKVKVFDIFWDDIVWVTRLGWYLRIYTKSGRLMLWNWNKDKPTESVNLNVWLEAVYQIWNIDYVYTGFRGGQKWIYYMNWYSLEPIVKQTTSGLLNSLKFDFDYTSTFKPLTSVWKQIFWTVDGDAFWPRLYKLWKDIEWLPSAITYYGKYSSFWLENTIVKTVNTIWNYVYYSFFDWVNRWVERIDIKWGTKTKEWQIITNTNTAWYGIFKKTAKYIYFKVWDVDANNTIDAYISFDGWSFTLLWTVDEQPLDWIARLPIQWDFRDFNVKFVFKTTNNSSPKIYYWYAFDFEDHNI